MVATRASMIVIGLILIVDLLLCGLVLVANNGDPVAFAYTGTRFTNRTATVPSETVTVGYDGQFVYYIARDGAKAVPLIDGASFRYQRILLPITGRALALGNPDLVPWTLLIINITAHVVGAGLMASLVRSYGASGILAGLTYGLWVGILFAVRLTLTEVLCFALGLGAVLLYGRQQYRTVVILLMLSTITKEIGLVFAAGLALHSWAERRRGWAVLLVGAPLLLLLTWWGILRLWLGDVPTQYPAARIQLIPLRGMFLADTELPELMMLILWIALPTVILLALTLRRILQQRRLTLTTALLIPAAGFVFTLPDVTWADPVAAYRVAMPILIMGLLFSAEHHPRMLKFWSALWLTSLLLVFLLPQLWLGAG